MVLDRNQCAGNDFLDHLMECAYRVEGRFFKEIPKNFHFNAMIPRGTMGQSGRVLAWRVWMDTTCSKDVTSILDRKSRTLEPSRILNSLSHQS
mmetsp:Transcript_4540/g.9077  ORF Transcript_4540/g.9077 Transcript_4540/m.9077 type:complete len:93 (-) Transcript_4540:716-994(-)